MKKSKKDINKRKKGGNGELEFIAEMKLVCNVEMKKNRDQAAEGGHDLVVAKRTTDLAKWIDDQYCFEVKRRSSIKPADLKNFWEQARKQAVALQKMPVLAYREDFRKWRVVFPLLWGYCNAYDGPAEMSLLGACKYMEHEMRRSRCYFKAEKVL